MSVNEALTGAWVTAIGPSGRLVTDYSPYRQHATMTGGVTLASWSRGWSANYNGSTGATLGYSEHLHTGFPFSFAGWVKYVSAGSSGREIFHTDTDTGTTYSGWSFGAIFSGGLNQDIFLLRYGNGTTANRTLRASGPAALVVDDWYHVAISISAHVTGDIWINGVSTGSVWAGSATGLAHAAGTARIGYDTRTSRAWTNEIADVRTWGRAITEEEVRELYAGGPGYCLRPPRRRTLVRVSATGTTGSGSPTLAAATSTASGTQTFAGTAAPTLAAATSTASGTQRFSGTGASTLGAATSAATGTQTFAGTAGPVLGAATSTASGTQTISGSGSSTLGDAIGAATGTQGTGTIGTAAVTLAAATAAASGSLSFSGTASPSCGAATSTAVGTLTFRGPGSATLGAATGSAAGTQTYTGTAAVTLGTAYATASGSVGSGPVSGTVAVTLGTAYATASGTILAPMQPVFGVTVEGWTLRLDADAETLQVDADAQTLRVTGG